MIYAYFTDAWALYLNWSIYTVFVVNCSSDKMLLIVFLQQIEPHTNLNLVAPHPKYSGKISISYKNNNNLIIVTSTKYIMKKILSN